MVVWLYGCMVVLHGDVDVVGPAQIIPVADASEFASRISDHKLSIIPGADHMFNPAAADSKADELVVEILAAVSAPSSKI